MVLEHKQEKCNAHALPVNTLLEQYHLIPAVMVPLLQAQDIVILKVVFLVIGDILIGLHVPLPVEMVCKLELLFANVTQDQAHTMELIVLALVILNLALKLKIVTSVNVQVKAVIGEDGKLGQLVELHVDRPELKHVIVNVIVTMLYPLLPTVVTQEIHNMLTQRHVKDQRVHVLGTNGQVGRLAAINVDQVQ